MKRFQDYRLIEQLTETRGALVYRGKKQENANSVIVKILKASAPSVSHIARAKKEYQTIQSIQHDGVVRVIDFMEENGQLAIITDDITEPSVESYLEKQHFGLLSFLEIGIDISNTLGEIHSKEIFHGEIKPSHLYFDETSKRVRISDFGISTILTKKNDEIYQKAVIQRALSYISPEQTGRMNRWIDYRTDIYSLGIVFYEMLTGTVPFKSDDPMEVIYSHIAIPPVPPHEVNPDIPKVISDIIFKLLHKNAEERYQNVLGLATDLETCLKQFKRDKKILKFKLGRKDIPRRFIIPQKLYGRKKQTQTLMACFESVCKGMPQLMMVSGRPGIGKSALIKEIHKPVVAKRGFFVIGKYEQYRKDVPYSAIIQAFQGLIRQLLSQSDEKIEQWKEKLLSALGSNGRVISDVISDIELIIGPQPDLPVMGPEESRNRFVLVFEKFISVFSQADHPLVLFLDDLQRADFASLEMIKNIVVSDEIFHLFVIGAYRSNEVEKDHPLEVTLREIQAQHVTLNTINVGPLECDHVSRLIQDHLKGPSNKSKALGNLVYKKTGGNPFFVNQFLKNLYDHGMIQLDSKATWQWDTQKISDMQVTDNLVDLLVEKINNLQEKTRETLKICACIGNRFNLEIIASLQDRTVDDILEDLKEAIQEGLIDGTETLYFYHHDRIQEAAYSLLTQKQKSLIHYKIGKKTFEDAANKKLNGKVFYIADQLNAGVEWISTEQEKDKLVWLNFKAGEKAKASAAYATALRYYKTGLDLSGDVCWKDHYERTLKAYIQISEIYYLLGEPDKLEQVVKRTRGYVRNAIDQASFSAVLIKAYTSQDKYSAALEEGLDMLKQLDIDLPQKADTSLIFELLQDVMSCLADKSDDDLLNLPDLKDETMLSATRIIVEMSTAAYSLNKELSTWLWLEMMRIYLHHGMHPMAAVAFVSYGVIQVAGLGDINSGVRFGQLAFKILDKYKTQSLMPRILNTYNLLIRHWVEPVEKSAVAGLEVHRLAMETGDLEYAALGLFMHDTYSIIASIPLQQLDKKMEAHGRIIKKLNQHHVVGLHLLWRQLVLNLMGKNKNPLKLSVAGLNEKQIEQAYIEKKEYIHLCNFYQIKCGLLFSFENYLEAFDYLKKAEEYQTHIRGLINSSTLVFFGTVIRLAIYHEVPEDQKKELLEIVETNFLQMQHWMKFSTVNFSHRCKLVEAMKTQIAGDVIGAMDLYDEAIDLFHKNGYGNEVEFATALAAHFFTSQGKKRIAHLYLKETYDSHVKKGRQALVRYYGAKYPFLRSDNTKTGALSTTKKGHASQLLDIKSVVNASQAISGEILLGNLLTKMMQIVLKSAGAQKGYMILSDNDALFVEAESNAQDEKILVLQSIPVDRHKGFSQALVNVVARTRKTLILNHACQEGDFTQDIYFKTHQSKSVLCQAIINQGRLVGVLYLENNLAEGVFTPKHLEVLRIIASQAAISIENSKLYANLEQKVQERTKELEDAYEKIKRLANTDPLTQLSNRRDMLEKINSEKVRLGRNKGCAALIIGDIDNFKMINDTYGHDCGDYTLKLIADTMKTMVRKQDSIARWGGEEFLFLLPKTDTKGAKIIAEKVRKAICKKPIEFNSHVFSISMTFGVSSFDDPDADIDIYLKKADDALYKGKETGKNRVILSD